jgi:hypothetical protein
MLHVSGPSATVTRKFQFDQYSYVAWNSLSRIRKRKEHCLTAVHSQYAWDYSKLFGELPSQTLRGKNPD